VDYGSAFFAVVEVGVAVFVNIYCAFAVVVGAFHPCCSLSFEKRVVKGFGFVAWASFAQ